MFTPSVRRPVRAPKVRRKVARLKAQLSAQERELLRRHNTALGLARDVSALREELASAHRERQQLERRLERVVALRAAEAAQARRLGEAVLDQQAAVVELERAAAAALTELR